MAWNESGGNRDPWNGGRRKDGPPDLDEMLKRLRARFSGTGGGGGRSLPSGGAGLVGIAIVVLWLLSGFYIVDEQERAAVLRFGAYTTTTNPGLRWHIPWPVEKEERVNVTGVRSVTDKADMLTQDENIVELELTVQYRVSSAQNYLFNISDPDMTLRQATKSAVREVVGQSKMDFILTLGREEVADKTKRLLQERLDEYKSGLVVTEVNLQQAQPPELVQPAFADAIKAREDQQRLKNEAEAYANDRLPKARGGAARQIAEAEGYRDRLVAEAEGDASRFTQLLAEYKKAPRVTRERLYLETMGDVLGSTSKVLIDVDKGGPMIYLPLEQMLKNSGKTAAAADEIPSLDYAPPRTGSGSQDSRSRDRGGR
jgi:membrane protease subunit HflK